MNKSGLIITLALMASVPTYPATSPQLESALNMGFNAVSAVGLASLVYYLFNREYIENAWKNYHNQKIENQLAINAVEEDIDTLKDNIQILQSSKSFSEFCDKDTLSWTIRNKIVACQRTNTWKNTQPVMHAILKEEIITKEKERNKIHNRNRIPWNVKTATYGSILGIGAIIGWCCKAATKAFIEYRNS